MFVTCPCHVNPDTERLKGRPIIEINFFFKNGLVNNFEQTSF